MIVTGAYLADHVQGFQTSFEKFGANDRIPYYRIMYYGGIAQAAYGSVLVFLGIAAVVLFCAFEDYKPKQIWVETATGEMAVPNGGEKRKSQV